MSIKKVTIEEGCIGCGLCAGLSPEVFEMDGETAVVLEDADLNTNQDTIIESRDSCPVDVIKTEE